MPARLPPPGRRAGCIAHRVPGCSAPSATRPISVRPGWMRWAPACGTQRTQWDVPRHTSPRGSVLKSPRIRDRPSTRYLNFQQLTEINTATRSSMPARVTSSRRSLGAGETGYSGTRRTSTSSPHRCIQPLTRRRSRSRERGGPRLGAPMTDEASDPACQSVVVTDSSLGTFQASAGASATKRRSSAGQVLDALTVGMRDSAHPVGRARSWSAWAGCVGPRHAGLIAPSVTCRAARAGRCGGGCATNASSVKSARHVSTPGVWQATGPDVACPTRREVELCNCRDS